MPIGGACLLADMPLAVTRSTCSVVSDQPALLTSHISRAPDSIDAALRNHIVTGCAACRFAASQMSHREDGLLAVKDEDAEG